MIHSQVKRCLHDLSSCPGRDWTVGQFSTFIASAAVQYPHSFSQNKSDGSPVAQGDKGTE